MRPGAVTVSSHEKNEAKKKADAVGGWVTMKAGKGENPLSELPFGQAVSSSKEAEDAGEKPEQAFERVTIFNRQTNRQSLIEEMKLNTVVDLKQKTTVSHKAQGLLNEAYSKLNEIEEEEKSVEHTVSFHSNGDDDDFILSKTEHKPDGDSDISIEDNVFK